MLDTKQLLTDSRHYIQFYIMAPAEYNFYKFSSEMAQNDI